MQWKTRFLAEEYYQLSCQRLYITNLVVKKDLRKKAQNGPFLRGFQGILPVNFQNNNKLKKNIAKKGNRTLDLHFTRVSLYQLSYFGADLE